MIFLIITASLLQTLQLRNMMEHIKKYIIHFQKLNFLKSSPHLYWELYQVFF